MATRIWSLENIMRNADKIKGKVGENLRASSITIPLTKTLATIKLDVDLNIEFDDLKRKTPDKETLNKLYQELEFKNWLAELLEKTQKIINNKYADYETFSPKKNLDNWLTKFQQADIFAFDTETTSLRLYGSKISRCCHLLLNQEKQLIFLLGMIMKMHQHNYHEN